MQRQASCSGARLAYAEQAPAARGGLRGARRRIATESRSQHRPSLQSLREGRPTSGAPRRYLSSMLGFWITMSMYSLSEGPEAEG